MSTRRSFIKAATTFAASTLFIHPSIANRRITSTLKVAGQQYTWMTYFQRDGKNWFEDLDRSFESLLSTGMTGYEPSFDRVEQVQLFQPFLEKHGIWTTSMYVNSTLHDSERVEQSIGTVLDIAKAAKPLGIQIVVTNPSPIQWGGADNKTDEQLTFQATALDRLGAALREMDMVLAYHNHDPEMRESAREFHHMMLGTDPNNVHLCLDAHWIYRGSGNSQVALFDIVRLYGDRIVEVHLRQSHDGTWSEVFGPGDIDYGQLAETLLSLNLHPHLVLEQAPEKGTPKTMDAVEANRRSLAYIEEVFADFER